MLLNCVHIFDIVLVAFCCRSIFRVIVVSWCPTLWTLSPYYQLKRITKNSNPNLLFSACLFSIILLTTSRIIRQQTFRVFKSPIQMRLYYACACATQEVWHLLHVFLFISNANGLFRVPTEYYQISCQKSTNQIQCFIFLILVAKLFLHRINFDRELVMQTVWSLRIAMLFHFLLLVNRLENTIQSNGMKIVQNKAMVTGRTFN